jgi:enoyl-[acyl-carrier protein] reductase III
MRTDRAAEEAASELRALGAEPILVRGNVASQRVVDEVRELGPLDVLVHAAATGVIRPALETEDKHWDWTLSANSRALLSLARAAAPAMPPGASIIGLSSLGSTRVLENYALVGASKAALEALVRYLAVELAPGGIRVNAVSAGVVETGALEYFPNREAMLEMGRRNPVGRIVSPGDVAACVTFLCSPDAEMIRGQILVVDGGWSLLASLGASGSSQAESGSAGD